jgi:hypothetical protein
MIVLVIMILRVHSIRSGRRQSSRGGFLQESPPVHSIPAVRHGNKVYTG